MSPGSIRWSSGSAGRLVQVHPKSKPANQGRMPKRRTFLAAHLSQVFVMRKRSGKPRKGSSNPQRAQEGLPPTVDYAAIMREPLELGQES